MTTVDKKEIQKKFQLHDKDTGSSAVQVAVLSKKIEQLTEHLKLHKKDHSSRFGLIKMVNSRRRLLDYINKNDHAQYAKLIKDLKIRR